ncbi:MAG: hypothetical protein ACLP8Y_05465 [Thermoplasmata archaeon]
MELEDVASVGNWLRSAIGVPFVVVGGSAVERVVPVATKDVDLLIDSSDWAAIDSALESRKDAAPLEPTGGSIRGTVVTIGSTQIDLEFLSDEPFSGRSGPRSFTRFVREQESVVHEGIRYATPRLFSTCGSTRPTIGASTSRPLNGTLNPASRLRPLTKQ